MNFIAKRSSSWFQKVKKYLQKFFKIIFKIVEIVDVHEKKRKRKETKIINQEIMRTLTLMKMEKSLVFRKKMYPNSIIILPMFLKSY